MKRFNKQIRMLGIASLICILSVTGRSQTLPQGFKSETLVSDLNTPVSLAQLPDGRFIILEQYVGNALLVNPNDKSRDTLLVIPDFNPSGGNERGLLSVAVDPNFSSRPFIYFYYTAQDSQVRITRYSFANDSIDPKSRTEILKGIPDNAWNHNGGSLRFDVHGYLYLSMGDDANSCLAQNLDDPRGSILKMDVSKIPAGAEAVEVTTILPPDAPHADRPGAAGLIWHNGLRNPFRYDIDKVTGDMLIADVGLLDFEEIDCAPASVGGLNFGWPFFEGPAGRGQPGCARDSNVTYTQPIDYYDRTGFQASVISLCVYRADSASKFFWGDQYQGAYFYAEYFKGFIRCLKRGTDGKWTRFSPDNSDNWGDGISNIPEATVGRDGAVYYLRQFNASYDPNSGQLCRIIPNDR